MDVKPSRASNSRYAVTVSSCYNIFPTITGGQQRIYHLYKNLSNYFNINLITYSDCGTEGYTKKLSPNLLEMSIPFSELQCMREEELKTEYGMQVYEYSIMNNYSLTPDYLNILERSMTNSDVTIVSHPYTFPAVKQLGGKRIWYDAHNVEYEVKRATIDDNEKHREVLEKVRQVEGECCEASELIMVCSERDKSIMCNMYKINPKKVIIVPNGTEDDKIKCILPINRHCYKRAAGISKEFTAFFIGAYYEPNITAVEKLIKIAERLKSVTFVIAGDVCNFFDSINVPENVKLLGRINEQRKERLLSACDVALNPMLQGSGTNLKMLEYFSYGIPVISTPLGARGFDVKNGKDCIICGIESFSDAIEDYMKYNKETKTKIAKNARFYVEKNFNWKEIAQKTGTHMLKLLDSMQ